MSDEGSKRDGGGEGGGLVPHVLVFKRARKNTSGKDSHSSTHFLKSRQLEVFLSLESIAFPLGLSIFCS